MIETVSVGIVTPRIVKVARKRIVLLRLAFCSDGLLIEIEDRIPMHTYFHSHPSTLERPPTLIGRHQWSGVQMVIEG